MSLSPADVSVLSTLVPLTPIQDSDQIPILRSMPLQFCTFADFRAAMVASAGSARFYGGVAGKPDAGETMFEIPMTGDEIFDAGLPGSIGEVDVAPTGSVTFALTVNGVSVGSMNVAAAATSATFTFSAAYAAAAGDKLKFTAPSPQDATLQGPTFVFYARR